MADLTSWKWYQPSTSSAQAQHKLGTSSQAQHKPSTSPQIGTYYRTGPISRPASSRTSRRTASSNVSPGSTKPARHEYIPAILFNTFRQFSTDHVPFGHVFCRPSRILSPASFRIPIMITWFLSQLSILAASGLGHIQDLSEDMRSSATPSSKDRVPPLPPAPKHSYNSSSILPKASM